MLKLFGYKIRFGLIKKIEWHVICYIDWWTIIEQWFVQQLQWIFCQIIQANCSSPSRTTTPDFFLISHFDEIEMSVLSIWFRQDENLISNFFFRQKNKMVI